MAQLQGSIVPYGSAQLFVHRTVLCAHVSQEAYGVPTYHRRHLAEQSYMAT